MKVTLELDLTYKELKGASYILLRGIDEYRDMRTRAFLTKNGRAYRLLTDKIIAASELYATIEKQLEEAK